MTSVSVDNDTVDITLSPGEGTTVPSGETWRVTIAGGPSYGIVRINGVRIGKGNEGNMEFQTTLTGGTNISLNDGMNNPRGVHIGGFVV
jgi:hypothetical protein